MNLDFLPRPRVTLLPGALTFKTMAQATNHHRCLPKLLGIGAGQAYLEIAITPEAPYGSG